MKKSIPSYDKHSPEKEAVYKKLSKINQKLIDKQVLSWSATAGKNKVEQKRKNLIKFADVVEKNIDKIDNVTYVKFAVLIKTSTLNEATKNDLRKHVKEFLRSNYDDWYKRFNNFKELRNVKEPIPKKYEDLPTVRQIEELIPKTPDLMLKTFIQIMSELGARGGSEVLVTKFGDFDTVKGTLKLISTKNKNVRHPLLKKSIQHINRWKKEYIFSNPTNDDFIFVNPKNRDKHTTANWVNGKLRDLGKRYLGRPISIYCIRHARLNELQSKLPVKIYEQVADHSIHTATRYSHLNKDDIINAMNEFVYEVEELKPEEKEKLKTLEVDFQTMKAKISAKDKEDGKFKKNVFQIIELLKETPEAVDLIVKKHGTKRVIEAIPDNFK